MFTAQLRRHIKAMVQGLLNQEGQGALRTPLIRSASGIFILKIASTGLAFLTAVLLARLLGAKGYGYYVYALQLIALLGIPTTLGLPQLVVRNVAAYHTRSEWGLMRGLLRRTDQVVLLGSLCIVGVTAGVSWLLANRLSKTGIVTFWIALPLLPITAFTVIKGATLQGLRHVVEGQLQMLLRPLLFLVLVVGVFLLPGQHISVPLTMGMQVAAAGIALIVVSMLLRKHRPKEINLVRPVYNLSVWTKSALSFLSLAGIDILTTKTDIIMVGAMKGAEATGIYSVVTNGAALVTLSLLAVNTALAPTVASLYAAGEMRRIQRVLTKSARGMLLFSLPVGLSLILFGHWILMIIFGAEFGRGAIALAILSAGQIVNVAMGSVGLVLRMTGHEHDNVKIGAVAAVLNITLNGLLIPIWGIDGAAIATATSLTIGNTMGALWLYKKLRLDSTALGRMSQW